MRLSLFFQVSAVKSAAARSAVLRALKKRGQLICRGNIGDHAAVMCIRHMQAVVQNKGCRKLKLVAFIFAVAEISGKHPLKFRHTGIVFQCFF